MINSKRSIIYIFLIPAILLLTFINLYPILHQIYISFTDMSLAFPRDAQIKWTNYINIIKDERFWHSTKILGIIMIGSVSLTVFMGTSLALAAIRIAWSRYIMSILIIPMVATPVVLAHFFQYLYSGDYGLVTYLLGFIVDLKGQSLISNPNNVLLSIILIDAWEWTPFVLLICWAGLTSIPDEIYDAAKIDGASKWKTLTEITLPLIKGSLITATIFRTVEVLRIFVIIWGLTKGGPGISSEVTSIYIYNTAFRSMDLGKSSAIATFLLVIVSCIAWFMVCYDVNRGRRAI